MAAESASDLRKRIQNAVHDSEIFIASSLLHEHDDLTWRDLIDGLDHVVLVAELAALNLHLKLKVPVQGVEVVKDKTMWIQVLADRGLVIDARCRDGH